MAIALIVAALILVLLVVSARPLARLFTRRTGTMVVTVKPTRTSAESERAEGKS